MKILLFGSTGPSGKCLVTQALQQGHTVTAFARNPANVTEKHPNLKVVRGDILDPASIDAAMDGQEAVLCVLGVRKLKRNTILSDGTKSIMDSMKRRGIRRFVCMTSLGVGDSADQMPWFFKHVIMPLILKKIFADKEIQERYIRESGLDWIIARPSRLTNGPQTGVYQEWVGAAPNGLRNKISRNDSVDFMLKSLTAEKYLRKAVGLSY
jgi:uncharacterized protein YbjT (DUF2867 family)